MVMICWDSAFVVWLVRFLTLLIIGVARRDGARRTGGGRD